MIRLDSRGVAWNICAWALSCILYLAFAGHAAFYSFPPELSKLAPISPLCIPLYGTFIYASAKALFISFNNSRILRRDV